MRRSAVVAVSALIAAAALIGLPGPASSTDPSSAREPPAAAFMQVQLATDAPALGSAARSDDALRAAGHLASGATLVERGSAPPAPSSRPSVSQPRVSAVADWKPPLSTMTGTATFYDNGTTAMRLPRGTVVRICGAGGCILRTVSDYGPRSPGRIVDLYRPDFFAVCGCAAWSGTTTVTVSVY